jgi:phosphoheptose isomerase
MIINGGSRCNAQFFAKHLTNGEENERVTLCEIRNLAAQTVAEAFREMEAIAMGTRCRN